jgi:hypothetical protein
VGHRVEHDVDAEGIGDALGEVLKIILVLPLALPAVAVVAVVGREDHHPALVVVDRPVVDRA